MVAFALHEDRLFFAMSPKGVEHNGFDVRICVDDFIDTMEFLNTSSSTDIRVGASSDLPDTPDTDVH
jgi:hypothetical protein